MNNFAKLNVFELGPLETNCYVLSKDGYALLFDPGGDIDTILDFLQKNSLSLLAIYITHVHFDHVYGVASLHEATKAPVFGPDGDRHFTKTELGGGGVWGLPKVAPFEFTTIEPGEHIVGPFKFIALHTPGHTPGSISFYFPDENAVFTGDVIFYRSIGRTDFADGNHEHLLKSITEKIFTLPPKTIIYPGHGPETNVDDERRNNQHCGAFNI